jgi:hypothetical protein
VGGSRGSGQQVVGGRPAAEGVGVGGVQRVRDAGQTDAGLFDFTRALECGAEPLAARGEDERRYAIGVTGAEDDRVAAAVVESDLLGFLPERRASIRIGVDRQRDGLNGAGPGAVGWLKDTRDSNQARNRSS